MRSAKRPSCGRDPASSRRMPAWLDCARSGRARRPRGITRASGREPLTGVAVLTVVFGIWVLGMAQASVLARMPLPLGAASPVLVTVLVLAHALGPVRGALFGAWSGLVLDLIPPAAGPVGGWALILTVAGLTMGYVCEARQPGPWLAIALVGVGAASVIGLRVVLLWFSGHSPALAPGSLVALCAGGTSVLLAPVGLVGAQLVAAGRPPRLRRLRASPLEPLVPLSPTGPRQVSDDVPAGVSERIASQVSR